MSTEQHKAAYPEYCLGMTYQEMLSLEQDYYEHLRQQEEFEEMRFWDNFNMSREERAMEEYERRFLEEQPDDELPF